ncbi:MAG: M15 family metallopeptidase [Succinivibrio sp.]|nr:M15 family metallopeptidase [Succinivibrio sp.]
MSYKNYLKNLSAACILSLCLAGSNAIAADDFAKLGAGDILTAETIAKINAADCFRVSEIPDDIWYFMQNKTYKKNPHIQREDLRYLKVLHVDFNNVTKVGELICNKAIAGTLKDIFLELYKNGYQIDKIILPDYYDADDEKQMRDNNTSAFCYREVKGTSVISKHAQGLAVDINTFYNPYCKLRKDGTLYVQPATAADYCSRTQVYSHMIDKTDLAYKLFLKHGFEWGGDWKSLKDYQHFEIDPKNLK